MIPKDAPLLAVSLPCLRPARGGCVATIWVNYSYTEDEKRITTLTHLMLLQGDKSYRWTINP